MSRRKPPATWSKTRAPITCSPRSRTISPSLFAAPDALDRAHVPVTRTARDRGHGRDETRTPAGFFRRRTACSPPAQAFWIEPAVRDPHDGRLRPAAAAPGITSRTLQRGGTPGAIAAAARGHRDIEALHQVRDTTMNEAAQRLRAGLSAQVIAAVRNAAVAAPRLAGFTSTAPGRRWAVRNPARPVTVLNLA